jgi:hypothetical protein
MSPDLELTHAIVFIDAIFCCLLTLLLAIGSGYAAWVWANAIAAAYRAHAHRLQVNAAEAVQKEAEEAIESTRPPRAPYVPPTEEEIRQSILAEREEREREYSTLENDGIPADQEPIPAGGMYRATVEPPF